MASSDPATTDVLDLSPLPGHGRRKRRNCSERGASLVEYALLVALIAVVCIAGVTQFGQAIRDSDMKSIATTI